MFQEIEKVKEQGNTTVSVLEPSDSLVTAKNASESFNPSSFLFGNKSSVSSIYEKTTPNAPLFGSKPVFGNLPVDFSKTNDTKSTKLFGNFSTVPSSQAVFGTFSAASPLSTNGSTELQNAIPQTSLFSKTDDVKSKSEGLFNFSLKSDSPFKFGGSSQDSKAIFGQSLLNSKDKSVNEDGTEGII